MKRIIPIVLSLLCVFPLLGADKNAEDLKERVCQALPEMHGWCSREKALNFIDLVLLVKPKLCVEIGTYGGASLFPVASTLKFLGKGVIIGIDPWDKIECIKWFDPVEEAADLHWWGNVNFNYILMSHLSMIKRHGLIDYCITLKTTSEKAAVEISPDSVDILYIDGNHSEAVSTQDVILYLPKVHSGGFIWFNDSLWERRQQAVSLLVESCDVVKLIDNGNCILFKKR